MLHWTAPRGNNTISLPQLGGLHHRYMSPPEPATGEESPSRSNLLLGPGKFTARVLFRPTKLLPTPHATPLDFA
jgi:hypothetical protein